MEMKEHLHQQSDEWLILKLEKATDRYIEDELFLTEIMDMPWYKKIFVSKKIIIHFKKLMKQYHDQ